MIIFGDIAQYRVQPVEAPCPEGPPLLLQARLAPHHFEAQLLPDDEPRSEPILSGRHFAAVAEGGADGGLEEVAAAADAVVVGIAVGHRQGCCCSTGAQGRRIRRHTELKIGN